MTSRVTLLQYNIFLLKYSGDLNTDHLNNRKIWIPSILKLRFQMGWYSNGWFMCYVLCTRPTIVSKVHVGLKQECSSLATAIWIPDPINKKTKWGTDVQYLNGWAVRYSKGIQILDHLASNLFSTIWIPK